MKQYMKFVKPSYENFVEPSKRFSDVILLDIYCCGCRFLQWITVIGQTLG